MGINNIILGDLVGIRYFEELEVKNISGSKTVMLTKPFNLMDVSEGDKVAVTLGDDGRITIEKVKK